MRRQMHGEGAVVGETVERAAARELAGARAILTLVEKCTRLLALPWRGQVTHIGLAHFDLFWYFAKQQLSGLREILVRAHRRIVAREYAGRMQALAQCANQFSAEDFQPSRQDLHDEVVVIAIDDE